jgi:hypothetical protein
MFEVSSGESILASNPALPAFQRFPASTVSSTSAGVRSPSALSRSNSSPVWPVSTLTVMPVFLVKASNAAS